MSMSTINSIGYAKYNKIIRTICLTYEQAFEVTKNEDIDVYSFIVLYAMQSLEQADFQETFMDDLILVLENIFRENVYFDKDLYCFMVGDWGVLHSANFDDFQYIIKVRNCLESIKEDIDNPDNERTRQLLEKRKKLRKQVDSSRKSNSDDEGISMFDLISIFAASEHMSLEKVFDYDIYQFNDQFSRMKIFKDYDVNIQALLAGAKSEDVNIQHWLSKIKNK